MYDLVIIGGGIAGFGAAMYAGRMQLKTLLLAEARGGTILLAPFVENYPGFGRLTGAELFKKIERHAEEYSTEVKNEKAVEIEKNKGKFIIKTGEKTYESKTVLLATGTELRKLNVHGEKEFEGKGVHYCALCDGFFYKDKIVGVVGGSDSAAKEALLLSQWAKKVYIIYRKEKIRAEPVITERIMKNKKIEIINNTDVVEIKGDKFVTDVILDKAHKGNKEFKLDGLFIDIGRIPLSDLAKKLGVKTNKKEEIITDKESKTNIPYIFAAGDVTNSEYKQAVTGVAEGVRAVFSAYEYIKHNRT